MTDIAIIGDSFMLSSTFEEKIREQCSSEINIRSMQLPWPDEPMEHGYAVEGMSGLKEYQGDPDTIVSFIGDAQILVTQLAPLSRAMLAQLPNLKFIAVSRGGPVNIDMQAAAELSIKVVNTPGRNASAVAEFTIGAILSETRLIRKGHEAVRQGEWPGDLYRADTTGRELNEQTVGVIGYGNIGRKLVKLLRAFGTRVLVCDPYIQLDVEDLNAGVELVSLDKLLTDSDIVTLHPRVTSETEQMMDAAAFAKMKKGAYFINTARGPLVDYNALNDALDNEHLGGVMLDTYAIEPVPADWPLLKQPNITLTPHIAGASVRTVTYAAEQAAVEIKRYLQGLPSLNPCN